ncbi:MAG: thioredoxin domain-containing protein, partial [Alphaproteobacteria bacterium]
VETIIIGKSQDPETRALISAALSAPEPNLVLQVIDPGATLAPGHPALGKTQLDGKPTAYVCRNQTCSEPITEAKVLSHGLCT